MSNRNRTIVLSGAGGDIGLQITRDLLSDGYSLACIERDEATLEAVRTVVGRRGPTKLASLDAASPTEVDEWIADLRRSSLPPVYGLVNCAGRFTEEEFEVSTFASWMSMLEGNLLTAMTLCRAILPMLRSARAGSVVNFASTAGEYGSVRPAAAYAAAKGAVISLTKSLAREYGSAGVRINAVSPGPTRTAGFNLSPNHDYDQASRRTLLGRMGEPGDISSGVRFLLGDDSAWITGSILRINGGSLL